MWKCVRCAPLAALLAAAQSALATGIEKPPSVPPEVEEARQACPTVIGPCYGYHPTRWRALPCCTPELVPPAGLPPAGSTPIASHGRRANGTLQPATADRGPAPRTLPMNPVRPVRVSVVAEDQ